MYDKGQSIERMGEKSGAERRGEYADTWENAMQDGVPEFNGGMPWGYTAPETAQGNNVETPAETVASLPVERGASVVKAADNLDSAYDLTSYGLDTASRMYGLETVLNAIESTDEGDADSANPIGAIYARIEPNPESRAMLYNTIRHEPSGPDGEAGVDPEHPQLGITMTGNLVETNNSATSLDVESSRVHDAIRATKDLLETIKTSDTFEGARRRAESQGQSIVQYLVGDETNPTLSTFLGATGAELGADANNILEELEQTESEKDKQEELEEEINNLDKSELIERAIAEDVELPEVDLVEGSVEEAEEIDALRKRLLEIANRNSSENSVI